jgi:ribosome-associated heat shock protein Hsp15
LSQQRGPAVVAQQLYEETEDSLREREQLRERLRLHSEPAQTIEHGRPTKRDRRELNKTWDQRWSASIDD